MLSVRTLRYRYPRPDRRDGGFAAAQERLKGTIWRGFPFALLVYRACHALGAALGRAGIAANWLTHASLLFALGAGISVARGGFGWAALWLILSGVCDALDGIVARTTGTVSRYGALLDSTVDRFADALPLLGLLIALGETGWRSAIPAAAMVSTFSISYVRARVEGLGAELPQLFMRRAERVVILVLALGLTSLIPRSDALLLVVVAVLGGMNLIGTIVAIRAAKRVLAALDAASAIAKSRDA
jgi:CDP-diacylglycerol--glycerol-3-phosphate 3-phosphatidyltransferase